MGRLHLFEFNDQPWLPKVLRDGLTDYLEYAERRFGLYRPAIPILKDLLQDQGHKRIVDLCSGAGGPWLEVLPRLREAGCDVDVLLTDMFPNPNLLDRLPPEIKEHIAYHPESVDVRNMPPELAGVNTMWTALHHFQPENVRVILADAALRRAPFAAFEFTRRHPLNIVAMFMAFFMVVLFVPFIRPFRWSRIFCTYTIPILPLIVVFDGIVSCLRTYSPAELTALTTTIDCPGYQWKFGEAYAKGLPAPILYAIGRPTKANDNREPS